MEWTRELDDVLARMKLDGASYEKISKKMKIAPEDLQLRVRYMIKEGVDKFDPDRPKSGAPVLFEELSM